LALGNEQGERSLKLGTTGEFDTASLSLTHKVRQSASGQRLTQR
jgi:hypothetical protein